MGIHRSNSFHRGPAGIFALLAGVLLTSVVACAQPGGCWLPGESLPGIDGNVLASATWDPDGPGPRGDLTVFGGRFATVADRLASNIVAWYGEDWVTFGDGLPGLVRAITVHDNTLVAAGYQWVGSNVNYVTRWDGQQWEQLDGEFDDAIFALDVYKGELLAGGWFTHAGARVTRGLAKWNGVAWAEFGGGVAAQSGFLGGVQAIHVHEGALFVGGSFAFAGGVQARSIARWDGSWHALGAGINGGVSEITSHAGQLAVVGSFTTAGSVAAGSIAMWDGATWTSPGGGVAGDNPFMHAVASFQGELYAGGLIFNFDEELRYFVKWNGASWESPGGGMNGRVITLTATPETLYVGGTFTTAGDTGSNGISRWDGDAWSAFEQGINDHVYTVEQFEGDIVIGGRFTHAGDVPARHIARRVGDRWEPMGTGLDGPVHDLIVFSGDLIACGDFHADGGWNIARWDGAAWQALGGGFNEAGAALAMTIFQGDLIVGGYNLLGSWPLNSNVARWDGENWSPMGTGYDAFPEVLETLLVHQGRLISAGRVSTRPVVGEWDGQRWQELEGLAQPDGYDTVRALAVYQGDLIAAGEFMRPDGIAGGDIARWDGAQWHSLSAGVVSGGGVDSGIWSLAVIAGNLICGGNFQSIDGIPAESVAQWDGAQWRAAGGGVRCGDPFAPFVQEFKRIGATLYVAGGFTIADDHVSAYLARWQIGGSCSGDIAPAQADGAVDIDDLLAVLSAWGSCPPPPAPCTANVVASATVVDIDDLLAVIGGWGPCP